MAELAMALLLLLQPLHLAAHGAADRPPLFHLQGPAAVPSRPQRVHQILPRRRREVTRGLQWSSSTLALGALLPRSAGAGVQWSPSMLILPAVYGDLRIARRLRRGLRRGPDNDKCELVFKEDGQEYAQATRMLSNGRCEAICVDGTRYLCHIRGKMHPGPSLLRLFLDQIEDMLEVKAEREIQSHRVTMIRDGGWVLFLVLGEVVQLLLADMRVARLLASKLCLRQGWWRRGRESGADVFSAGRRRDGVCLYRCGWRRPDLLQDLAGAIHGGDVAHVTSHCFQTWGPPRDSGPLPPSTSPQRGSHAASFNRLSLSLKFLFIYFLISILAASTAQNTSSNGDVQILLFRCRGLHSLQPPGSIRQLLLRWKYEDSAFTWDPGLSYSYLRQRHQQYLSVVGTFLLRKLYRPSLYRRVARSVHLGVHVSDVPANTPRRRNLHTHSLSRRCCLLSRSLIPDVIWPRSECLLVIWLL